MTKHSEGGPMQEVGIKGETHEQWLAIREGQTKETDLDGRLPDRLEFSDRVPEHVMAALNRMCSPLHRSRLTGFTAEQDAKCMAVIRAYCLQRDDGMCKSCVGGKCVTGPECVTLGRDSSPDDAKDAARYRYLRNLSIEQTGMPGQPCIAMPNGMQSGYYLTEETADYAVDTSMAEARASLAGTQGDGA